MSEHNTVRPQSTPGSKRLWALGISVAVHLAALTVLGGVHFGRRHNSPPPSADISVHVIEQVLQEPAAKPKPKIEPAASPTVQKPAPPPVEKPPLPEPDPVPVPVQAAAEQPTETIVTDAVLFAGTSTAARRICYVIDGSGSMFGLMYLVRQQVRESVLKLSPEQSFNVVFFMEGRQLLQAFDGRLEAATPAAKAEAMNLLNRIRPGGQTEAEAALEAALRLRDNTAHGPQVIYFVTDGFDLMDDGGRAFIRRVAALRQSVAPGAVVHTIGIWPDPEDRDILTQLAQTCGGRYIEVE